MEFRRRAARGRCVLRPEYPDAQVNLAFPLLQAGAFAEGWRGTKTPVRAAMPGRDGKHDVTAPPLGRAAGRDEVLIIAEQGLGDVRQFSRYLRVSAAGRSRPPAVQTPLVRLLAEVSPRACRRRQ